MVQTSEMWAKRSMLLKAIRCGAKRRSTVSKNQDFCLKPCSQPEQPGQRACQQPEKMSHRHRASPGSRLFASRMRFPVGTMAPTTVFLHLSLIHI